MSMSNEVLMNREFGATWPSLRGNGTDFRVANDWLASAVAFLKDTAGTLAPKAISYVRIGLAAFFWITMALAVAFQGRMLQFDSLYAGFFSNVNYPLMLAGLWLVDLIIAVVLLRDRAVYSAVTAPLQFGTILICAFVLFSLSTFGIAHLKPQMDSNRPFVILFALACLWLPRAISYVPKLSGHTL